MRLPLPYHHLCALLLTAPFTVHCAGATDGSGRTASDIDVSRQEVLELAAQDAHCGGPSECAALGFGSKACGGPSSFLAYAPGSPNAADVEAAAQRFTDEEDEYNRANQIGSDCSLEMAPEVTCSAGECVFVN
jgi:hypothetical protein